MTLELILKLDLSPRQGFAHLHGIKVLLGIVYALSMLANAQQEPSLKRTTDWIHDFVETRGHTGDENWRDVWHIKFNGCAAVIQDIRTDISCTRPENRDVCSSNKAAPVSEHTQSFNLKDLDAEPDAIPPEPARKAYGAYLVTISTRDDRKVVATLDSIKEYAVRIEGTSTLVELGLDTNGAAYRVAKAFRHAIKLCGGKPSAF